MRYNEKELAQMGNGKGEMEGRLNYKKTNSNNYYNQSAFKERWFKLKDNFLFYFRINDQGRIEEKQPAGVFVLENASIQIEHGHDTPFSFSISFIDEPEKRHIFSTMTEDNIWKWVSKLRSASYEHLRSQLYIMQSKIYLKTGKDPLLMVPRNEGSKQWAPGQPTPQENILVRSMNFTSHLSPQPSHNHVGRSKSFVNVLERSPVPQRVDKSPENPWPNHTSVERSKTSVNVFSRRQNPFNNGESGSSQQTYSRTAPSPPTRKKNSPLLSKESSSRSQVERKLLHPDAVCDLPPMAPQRRNSPKNGRYSPNEKSDSSESHNGRSMPNPACEDLIKF